MMGERVSVGGARVDNVLVEPGLAEDSKEVYRPAGAKVEYTLRFPTDASAPDPDDKVSVRGALLDVLNVPDHMNAEGVFGTWTNPWDMTVLVGRTLGDFDAEIRIVEMVSTVDSMGDPVYTESNVYTGEAQARMVSGSESTGEDEMTKARETWAFVVPWRAVFGELRPNSAWVVYGGNRYDIAEVLNIDNASEYASIKAVRRG